jgi:hypothetical protein
MSNYLEILSDRFGTSPALMALMIGAYGFCVLFPILFPILLAFRRRLAIQRKLLFLFTASAICYGSVAFVAWALQLPAAFYTIFVAPQMENDGRFVATSVTHAVRFMDLYGFLVYPVATAAFALVIGLYLSGRWNRVVAALQ